MGSAPSKSLDVRDASGSTRAGAKPEAALAQQSGAFGAGNSPEGVAALQGGLKKAASEELHNDGKFASQRPKVQLKLTEQEVQWNYTFGDNGTASPAEGAQPARYGTWALQGKRAGMEDTSTAVQPIARIAVRPGSFACDLVPDPLAETFATGLGGTTGVPVPVEQWRSRGTPADLDPPPDPAHVAGLSFFGIFDGHGGDWASLYTAKALPVHFANRLRRAVLDGLEGDKDRYDAETFSRAYEAEARQAGQLDAESMRDTSAAPADAGDGVSAGAKTVGRQEHSDADFVPIAVLRNPMTIPR